MAPPLLTLQDIALTFGGTPLLTAANLQIGAGDRVALVGRNGSGKSTLLRIAAGLVEPDGGRRWVQPGATLRTLAQEPDFTGFATTLDVVEASLGPGDDPFRARSLLQALGLNGDEAVNRLSGGEARRCALAAVLAPEPDILLLDEPTNHLDLPAIEWLEAELAASRSALVLISHDRRFLENLGRATVWLDRGVTRRLEAGFDRFESWRDELVEQEERDRHKRDRKLAAEADWLRYGVTARRKRNVRRLADLHALREAKRSERRAPGQVRLKAAEADLSGRLVVEAEGVSKSFDRPIVRDLGLRVLRGDRLALVGPNGAGKTTLLNLLTGRLPPDAGTVRLGANLETAILDQRRESLDPSLSVAETLTGGRGDTVQVGGETRHVVGYMQDFLFAPEQARTPVSALSGGERNRLMLARALARPSNLLVLDEPTNDLDLETLDLLQEMLASYPGTLILVSHDRDFLDRTATSVLMHEGEGRWLEYAGGYTDMVAQRGAGVAARQPASRSKAAAAEKPPRSAPKAAPKRRLGFNESHELKTLPDRIAGLESRVAALRAALADPALYERDRARFEAASRALGEAEAALQEAEDRWLTLAVLAEEGA